MLNVMGYKFQGSANFSLFLYFVFSILKSNFNYVLFESSLQ